MTKNINKNRKIVFMVCAVVLILAVPGCTQYVEVPVVETITETVIETVTVTEYIEVENTDRIDRLESEVGQYQDLISNLNELLGYVYLIEGTNTIGGIGEATAFALEYKEEIYIISAGHVVENKNGIFSNFRIINGVLLELLDYDNDYINKSDYAIFTGEIDKGFKVDLDNDNPLYRIGDTIVDYRITSIEGESGSPVIDIGGEVTEIATTDIYSYNTDIDTVLDVIDNMQ